MSTSLFQLTPEMHLERCRAECRQQAQVLRLMAEVLERPGMTLEELEALIEEEMPPLRTGLAVARNHFKEGLAQRRALEPVLELWKARGGDLETLRGGDGEG